MRLDKYLSDCNLGTRREVRDMIAGGRVSVNQLPAAKVGMQISNDDDVTVDGEVISYQRYTYLMLNKPAGVITATADENKQTVLDLIHPPVPKGLAPVGRLDRDTVGLLLLTNDGDLTHKLLSPKTHVAKTYFAKIKPRSSAHIYDESLEISNVVRRGMDESDVQSFKEGIELSDHHCLPAELEIISCDSVRITIYEGKYHQVKRMCAARGFTVTFLRRESMGSLVLDPTLPYGSYRKLTDDELSILRTIS